jgi:hypothetical protein
MCVIFTFSLVVAGFMAFRATYLMFILHEITVDLASFRASRFHSIYFHDVSNAPSRNPLLLHHGFVSHVSRTIIRLPLFYIQEWYKMRR